MHKNKLLDFVAGKIIKNIEKIRSSCVSTVQLQENGFQVHFDIGKNQLQTPCRGLKTSLPL
jgi:hypothetical protein